MSPDARQPPPHLVVVVVVVVVVIVAARVAQLCRLALSLLRAASLAVFAGRTRIACACVYMYNTCILIRSDPSRPLRLQGNSCTPATSPIVGFSNGSGRQQQLSSSSSSAELLLDCPDDDLDSQAQGEAQGEGGLRGGDERKAIFAAIG